MYILIFIRSTK